MASIMPKIKFYLFLFVVSIMINFIAYAMTYATNGNSSAGVLFSITVTAFVPYLDIVPFVFLNLPPELTVLFSIIIVVISSLKLWVLAEIVASHIPTINI